MDEITGNEPINSFSYETSDGSQLHTGMTLRQHFAGLAMHGIMSRMGDWNSVSSFDFIGKQALLAADSLIKVLNK